MEFWSLYNIIRLIWRVFSVLSENIRALKTSSELNTTDGRQLMVSRLRHSRSLLRRRKEN